MRTGIYVYSESATFAIDQLVVACPSTGIVIGQNGSQATLGMGVYKTSSSALQPTSQTDFEIVVIANDKDSWPDPPPRFWKTFSNMTMQQLHDFFPSALGVAAASSDAVIDCDDADWPEIRDILDKAGFRSTRAA